MIAAQVIIKDGLTEPLEAFGKFAPRMLDGVLKTTGLKYRSFLRKQYLGGQMLYSRPNIGPLWASLYVGRKKGAKHVFVIGTKKTTITTVVGMGKVKRIFSGAVALANIYEHSGGYVIEPKNQKCLVFKNKNGDTVFTKRVVGQERPFMSSSAAAFNWAEALDKSADRVIGEKLKQLGFGVQS
jgi:hypothetical protein